jgi:hypothetical protein
MKFKQKAPKKPGYYWILWPTHGTDHLVLPAELTKENNVFVFGLEKWEQLSEVPFWGKKIKMPKTINTNSVSELDVEGYESIKPKQAKKNGFKVAFAHTGY